MTDRPKIGWLLIEDSDYAEVIPLGIYTERHKAEAAAQSYLVKHPWSCGPSIIPLSIDCPADD